MIDGQKGETMETIVLDGVTFTKEVQTPHVGRMVKCGDCCKVVSHADRYSSVAVDPAGAEYKVFVRWCPSCLAKRAQ
jgi:hypothetical protein